MLNKTQLKDMARCSELSCGNCACESIRYYAREEEEAAKAALALLDMLKRLEYTNDKFGGHCPICDMGKGLGHFEGCELGNLLREVEG